MKRKLLALALGITTAVSAVPIMTSQALDPPMKGDLNLDWTINIADLVCMQKYLLGTGELDFTYGIYSADVNYDEKIDVFDYIELRNLVDEWCGLSKNDVKITSRFTQVDETIPTGVKYARPSSSTAVIRSVSDLEAYLAPYSVITLNGECVFIDFACQEVLDDLYARYDKEFFSDNILLLNYLTGTAGYEFESIQYEDEKLVIKYYDKTPEGLMWNDPLPPYIAEVAVPKDLWLDKDYEWQIVDKPSEDKFEAEVKSDFTNSIKDDAITASYDEPSVLTNTDELNAYLDGKFNTGVETALKDTYNDEFFENNVVIFDLYYQSYREDWITSVTADKNENGDIVLTYDRDYIDGFVDTGVQINQVVMPKSQYNGENVLKEKTWEAPVEAEYVSIDLELLAGKAEIERTDDTIKCLDKEGAWVNSEDEMRAYIDEVMSDELAEYLFPELYSPNDVAVDTCVVKPWRTNWNIHSIYMWVDTDIIGSANSLTGSASNDEQLTLAISDDDTIGCEAGSFLHIVRTDKEQSGKKVVEKILPTNQGLPHTDGECVFMQFGEYIAMVNQYTFGNRNFADIYRVYPRGLALYGASNYIGTVEFAEDYFPIKYSEYLSYGVGDNVVMEAGECSITMNDEQVTFRYKYSADSDFTEQTFSYTRNYY
ncbi:MAG: dockerin type I repeat-containing protein [Ruminococcus flavefaciens]|nr:dockerin type I repeat-containing protein [Ruminococcus flavefaciens]MCM1229567.1 dockerin type I repeat-containing protein [Ruminococcus flavefaciens]